MLTKAEKEQRRQNRTIVHVVTAAAGMYLIYGINSVDLWGVFFGGIFSLFFIPTSLYCFIQGIRDSRP